MTKKKVVRRPERQYNLENGTLTMNDKEGNPIVYTFVGLQPDVVMKLAMMGAGSLLCKTDKPLALWEKIRQNRFGRRRTYANMPKVVYAISRMGGESMEKAVNYWKGLDKKGKTEIKNHPEVKKELLKMQIEVIDEETTASN